MSPAAPHAVPQIPESTEPKRGRGRPKGSSPDAKTPAQKASAIVNKIAKLESALGKLHAKERLEDDHTVKIENFLIERQERLFRIFKQGATAQVEEFNL